ncbi:hypothetical protein [Gorillibacterium massiliense]|uniref:hypothetical protein n=1 Tax=Gorillibacterium massiliense TaxID=1280390 RepID=UPI00059296D5|nr:hypothetical protein [Gorillibacterium massiliense]
MRDHDGWRNEEKCKGEGHRGRHHQGAQTFRRGRALEFLERLNGKRATLKQQLEAPEFTDIKPVLLGELKAVESIIDEYTRHFEIREREDSQTNNQDGKEEGSN